MTTHDFETGMTAYVDAELRKRGIEFSRTYSKDQIAAMIIDLARCTVPESTWGSGTFNLLHKWDRHGNLTITGVFNPLTQQGETA